MKNHRPKLAARLRVAIGLLAGLIMTGSVIARADEVPRKLVFADTGEYDTFFIASAKNGATETVTGAITNCPGGAFGRHYSIAPEGAEKLADLSRFLCGGGITLLDAPTNVDIVSVVRFRDNGERSSFAIGPIGAVTFDRPSRVGPLVNDDDDGAWITVFPEIDGTPFYAEIYDGLHLFVPAIELFTAYLPVTQVAIKTKGVFFAEVSLGFHPTLKCMPSKDCSGLGALYGFANSGDSNGGTFRAFPFAINNQ